MPENESSQFEGDIIIADLYPDLSLDELAEAEYRMLRYLAVVKAIFERICQENPKLLTKLERQAMLKKERNNSLNRWHFSTYH